MRLSVYGLGYVGTVLAACLAADGHEVVGVDPTTTKVDLLNAGRSPVLEPGLAALVAEAVGAGRLRATPDAAEGVVDVDIAWVCVGTPSRSNGEHDLTSLERVASEIGAALRRRTGRLLVVLRTTVTPGTTRDVLIPRLEATSGKRHGVGFAVCVCPEFLREGSAVADFRNPPKVVVGGLSAVDRPGLLPIVVRGGAPVIETSYELAELAKPVDNAWHALKIAFANEVGRLSKVSGLDGRATMEVLCSDRKLNLSAAYLRPGFAFGGSCLPKDVRALAQRARSLDLDLPLLTAILPSNERHLDRALQMILEHGSRNVGFAGLSFKAGTDDLRESPILELVERLLGKGYNLRIHDSSVDIAGLTGSNRAFMLTEVPHLARHLVATLDDVLQEVDIIVLSHSNHDLSSLADRLPERVSLVIDLGHDANADGASLRTRGIRYEGICW